MTLAHRARRPAALLAAITLLGLSGCSLLPVPEDPPALYTLSPKTTFDENLPKVSKQLLVETPIAAEGLNSHRIALSKHLLSIDYFANARWTERAPLMVQTLLVESFENTNKIVSVAREGTDLRADYALKTELREFQAEYSADGAEPTVEVRVIAKLVKLPERSIIASDAFGATIKAEDTSMDAIIVAFDDALGKVLKRVVSWTMPAIAK